MFEYNIFETHLKSEVFGRHIKYFNSIYSTNSEAINYLSQDNHGHVIITKNQTSGKGRRSDRWFSTPNKSLTFSIIVNQKKIKNKNLLPIITAVAIIKAINKISKIQCSIKWPNDIMLNNQKIGGILIEKKNDYMIVGVGINVNEEMDDLNTKIKNISTSLRINSAPLIQLEALLAYILNELEKCCYEDKTNLIDEWLNLCYHIDKEIKFYENHKVIKGIFKGINANGQGIININNQTAVISSGMIEL